MSRVDRITSLARSVVRPDRECIDELEHDPVPLYSDMLDVALLWNAKAACTFAVKWLFWQEGVLEEAAAYSGWAHDYRENVFCRRPAHAEALRRIPTLGDRAIKFVRNPFDRAVGSYLFFTAWAQRKRERAYLDILGDIGRHVERDVVAGEAFSFREFIDYLASIDLDAADVHLRRQESRCERMGLLSDLTIVRVEESTTRLAEVEERLGLRRSDPSRLRVSNHHTTRVTRDGFFGDERFKKTLHVPIPLSHQFYDDALARTVGELFRADIERYGYDIDGPRRRAAAA